MQMLHEAYTQFTYLPFMKFISYIGEFSVVVYILKTDLHYFSFVILDPCQVYISISTITCETTSYVMYVLAEWKCLLLNQRTGSAPFLPNV